MKTAIYWIEGPWPGRLAILPRPRGGDWLKDDLSAWRQAGLNVIVSLLTEGEAVELELEHEAELCRAAGMTLVSFPITDRSVPASRTAATDLIRNLSLLLDNQMNVGVHCQQGIGRSALVTIGVLIASGIDVETAIQRVGEARGFPVPETDEQRQWLVKVARQVESKA